MRRLLAPSLGLSLGLAICAAAPGCADADPSAPSSEVPATYTFDSHLTVGASSVAHGGQTARNVLIADLAARIGGLTGAVDGPTWSFGAADEVYSYLDYFVAFDSDSDGTDAIALSTSPSVLASHQTYAGISSGKNLIDKLAGQDDKTDHKNWDGGDFAGWSDTSIAAPGVGVDSPKKLLEAFLHTLAQRAVARADGQLELGPDGVDLPVHVTPAGQDLKQLVQKFLLMAVNYSQGTDDYLDSDTADKGLLSAQIQDTDKPYTKLEHAWDEGFGYFGAATDYGAYSDDEISAKDGRADWQGYHDTDGDGVITLTSEYNFGASVNAAKRDRGSKGSVAPTDFTGEAFLGFRTGRAIIAGAAGGALTADQQAKLEAARDMAVTAWEKAIAATCVHYINEVLADIARFGTDYKFLDYAKHWSELKGFALGLQFNPRSRLSDTEFVQIHTLIGDSPVSPDGDATKIATYKLNLQLARGVFMSAYAFPPDLKGDDDGAGGW